MTLKKRLTAQIGTMIAGVLLLAVTAVVGVRGLHQDFGVALLANEQTRRIYTVGAHVAAAKSFLEHKPAMSANALAELKSAVGYFDLFNQSGGFSWVKGTQDDAAKVRSSIETAISHVEEDHPTDASTLDGAYSSLANFSTATRHAISDTQAAADAKHRVVLAEVFALSCLITLLAGWVGLRQYHGVITPLRRMQDGVRRIAAGQLTEQVSVAGDVEFATLASDFNHMAGELRTLYEELERRIESKSRELVQSERLASVGYLAAGVAHEINNPLGIIAGYGERSLQRLDREPGADAIEYARNAIKVMCDESFRCKQITDRLLMLARPGETGRREISLEKLAKEVIASIGTLPRFAGRRVTLEPADTEALWVIGNEGELRQVILNLVANALEASDQTSGHVKVSVAREDEEIALSVQDNGHGMTRETVSRVFEPFFTQKRGERSGTGLGLSVAYAIVADHKGRIEAMSAGPNQGSRFIARLPASRREEACNADRA